MITSTTLAGHGSADLIGDAIQSVVDHVDRCLILDSGIGEKGIDTARIIAGPKLIVQRFSWPNDFAAARNATLRAAESIGADWAITVDTDERLLFHGAALRDMLSTIGFDILSAPQSSGAYTKPRCFRIPATGQWVGKTHEYFDRCGHTIGQTGEISFFETEKSPERLQKKLNRDLAALRQMTAQDPQDPRWWYYLGDTLSNLGDPHAAIDAFDRCASLNGWDEEAAWARYREAECWLALDLPENAIASCARGLANHAGIAELAWLAGFAAWTAKRYQQAVYWSQLALVHGASAETGAVTNRIGFRNQMALHEGPWDVLRFAWKALGNDKAAADAEQQFQLARHRRLGESKQ